MRRYNFLCPIHRKKNLEFIDRHVFMNFKKFYFLILPWVGQQMWLRIKNTVCHLPYSSHGCRKRRLTEQDLQDTINAKRRITQHKLFNNPSGQRGKIGQNLISMKRSVSSRDYWMLFIMMTIMTIIKLQCRTWHKKNFNDV